uniref:Uncharacterized protein n=1 Tax=Tanacetum cinerariifolium TaxID=118510 RepID=A0A6L2LXJ1_TANCI|nr:hypothetical protein [Tanacetum cinerariifolium]
MSRRQFSLALGLHTAMEMESAGFGLYWVESARQISDKGDLSAYWRGVSFKVDFLGAPPSYTHDPMMRLCHRLISCSITKRSQAPEKQTVIDLFYLRGIDVGSANIPYLLARNLRMFSSGRKHEAMISRGQFLAQLAEHFGLLTEQRLWGLAVIVRDLMMIDMAELVQLQICEVTEGVLDVDEGAQAVPAPIQAPQPPHAVAQGRTMAQRYTSYSDFQIWYVRRTRCRTDDIGTSAPQQPDP